jgi:hypothetical protein
MMYRYPVPRRKRELKVRCLIPGSLFERIIVLTCPRKQLIVAQRMEQVVISLFYALLKRKKVYRFKCGKSSTIRAVVSRAPGAGMLSSGRQNRQILRLSLLSL